MNESPEFQINTAWLTPRKILTAAIVLVCTLFVATMVGLFSVLHGANKVLHIFGDALQQKQYERAYSLTSKEFQASANFGDFKNVHDGLIRRMGELKNIEVTESEVKEREGGWYGTAEANLNFSDGSLHFIFTLKKESGSWKIYNYHEE
jgi:hypothetical protein